MNIALAIFGAWAIGLGAWATVRAIKANEIASVFTGNYRPTISRQRSPAMFWAGIAFFSLVAAIGIAFLVASFSGLRTT